MDPQRALQRLDEVVCQINGSRAFHREIEECISALALAIVRAAEVRGEEKSRD